MIKNELKTWIDEYGNILREDGKIQAANGEWVEPNPWKPEVENLSEEEWVSLDPVLVSERHQNRKGKYWMNKKARNLNL